MDSHPDVTLRPLTTGDATEAAALIRVAFATQSVATDPPSSALRETSETVRSWVETGGGIGAVSHGALVAVLLWTERDGGLYCGRLAVSLAARGHGIARALMAAADGEAQRRALPRVSVRVRLELPDNIGLFLSLGFHEVAREAHAGYEGTTTAVMEKRFAGLAAAPRTHGPASGAFEGHQPTET